MKNITKRSAKLGYLDTKLSLEDILASQNLCEKLSTTDKGAIGERVTRDFKSDTESMKDWREMNKKALEIIKHDFTNKSSPWPGAANAKIPLIYNAAIKFQSEAGAELMKGDELVKTEVFGEESEEKVARSERVKAHMNYQLFHEMENWDGDMDQLLMVLPIIGCLHKHVKWDAAEKVNKSELCLDNITIAQDATSTKKARVTREFSRDKNQIYENETAKLWSKTEYNISDDEDGDEKFVEQYRRLDLDGDGYEEPYIVTVHVETQMPVRILANFKGDSVEMVKNTVLRIPPLNHFVKYGLIPAPDGTYWSYGWGILLGPLSNNVNTIVNQMLDAATASNLPAGWIASSVRGMAGGDNKFKPGEYKRVKTAGGPLKDSIVNLPFKEPSNVMFALLELLVESAKDITSVTDVMSGEQPQANMAAATVMALIERGRVTFSSIYKRIYRSMKAEFKHLFALNALYTDPAFYGMFFDAEIDPQADYDSQGWDITPTANPEFSSRIQRIAQAESLMPLAQAPEVNQAIIYRRYVEGVTEDTKLAAEIVPDQPNMTPDMVAQEMENAKQEMLANIEVDTKQKENDKAAIELEMARVKAMELGVSLPEKTALAQEKTDEQELKTDEQALKTEKARVDLAAAHKEATEPEKTDD